MALLSESRNILKRKVFVCVGLFQIMTHRWLCCQSHALVQKGRYFCQIIADTFPQMDLLSESRNFPRVRYLEQYRIISDNVPQMALMSDSCSIPMGRYFSGGLIQIMAHRWLCHRCTWLSTCMQKLRGMCMFASFWQVSTVNISAFPYC